MPARGEAQRPHGSTGGLTKRGARVPSSPGSRLPESLEGAYGTFDSVADLPGRVVNPPPLCAAGPEHGVEHVIEPAGDFPAVGGSSAQG